MGMNSESFGTTSGAHLRQTSHHFTAFSAASVITAVRLAREATIGPPQILQPRGTQDGFAITPDGRTIAG